MVAQLGTRLPEWTPEEVALVKGSNDFYGMNHYCANFIRAKTGPADPTDVAGNLELHLQNKAGEWVGPETQSPWLRPSPIGFRKLLKWLSDRYGRPKIYVTENGTSLKGENDLPLEQLLKDDFRVEYFEGYVRAMAEAYTIDGVNVRAYMGWSLMEYVPSSSIDALSYSIDILTPCSNFEWAEGYETRFGVTFVDYENDQKRYPKASAKAMPEIFAKYIQKA